jgi:hypothetical protein
MIILFLEWKKFDENIKRYSNSYFLIPNKEMIIKWKINVDAMLIYGNTCLNSWYALWLCFFDLIVI